MINHVGLVVEEGNLRSSVVVEALTKVKRHRLWIQYGPPKKDRVAVFRPRNLNGNERKTIIAEAESQVGRKYAYFMLFLHLLDWFLLGAYVFRRIARTGEYPICSWVVAHAFSKAGKDFGVEPGEAQPDDIWDFIIEKHPELYEKIYPLAPLA